MPIYEQFESLFRLAISFSTLFFIMATIIFKKEHGQAGERFFSRFIKMIFLIIVVGYVFVLLKLYEVISLFAFITLFSIFWRMPAGNRMKALRQRYSILTLVFYETLDSKFSPWDWAKNKAKNKSATLWKSILTVIKSPLNYVVLAVISGAAYLRFSDPLSHAAPGMSDASVAVAWMKYISERILFHDGIYPQGLHIFNATVRKFAGTDAIYVVKFIGPFNGVLTTIALYYFVQHLTGRKTAGIISAFVFGILGPFLYLEWDRQAATNSQEFALIFIFLAWHYMIRFFNTKEKSYLGTATVALAVMGLVHSLVWAFACLGVVLIALSYFVFGPIKNFKTILYTALACIISGAISGIPLVIGLFMDKGYHSSSLDYLTSAVTAEIQKLAFLDYLAAGGIVLMTILLLLSKWMKERPEPLLFTILISATTLLSYIYLGWLTGNTLIITRIGLLWSIILCLAIGVGWHALLKVFKTTKPVELFLCIGILVIATNSYRPAPAQPYKMYHDVMLNQYIRISKEFTPTTWTMVSNEEGYALSLNKGWHMHLWDLVDGYSPETEEIVKRDASGQVLDSDNIFLFIEKVVFEPPLEILKPIVENRKEYYSLMEEWVNTYSIHHNNIEVYYEDENIKVYHIHQPRKNEFNEIWNIKDIK